MTNYIYSRPKGAVAYVRGSKKYPSINGEVYFYKTTQGIVVETSIYGLTKSKQKCSNDFCGMHIHEGTNCDEADNNYPNIKLHYNKDNCMHPAHTGDLLPIVKNTTLSYSKVLYTKFRLEELIGKFVIIHQNSDDFTTDPHGEAGEKIACGRIVAN